MSGHEKSIYVLNKFSKNIVYRFGDEIKEISLEDYLKENPTHTKENFLKIKKFSDEIFYEEDLAESRYRKKKRSIHMVKEEKLFIKENPLSELIKKEEDNQLEMDIKRLENAIELLLDGKKLTEIQKRRFILYFYHKKSLREIAALEGVNHNAIHRSIKFSMKKIKTFFQK